MENAGPALQAARGLTAKGRFKTAAELLAPLCSQPDSDPILALELARTLLRMGHVARANDVVAAVARDGTAPGIALRLGLEAVWIDLLRTFRVAEAVAEAERLWAKAPASAMHAAERADAERILYRILRAAANYREVSPSRQAEAKRRLEAVATTLLDAGWIEEGLTVRVVLAGWQAAEPGSPSPHLALADRAERLGALAFAAEAWLNEAERLRALHEATGTIREPLARARALYASIGHELGLLDVARVEALLQVDRHAAPLRQLEDLLEPYARHDVPSRHLILLSDLSLAALNAGDLPRAVAYRERHHAIADAAGLGMTRLVAMLEYAEVSIRQQRLTEAIDVCEAALEHSMPRVMQAQFRQLLASAFDFASDRARAASQRNKAIAAFEEIGAEDLVSIAITQAVNSKSTSLDDDDLNQAYALAGKWAARDAARGDFEAAATKHQLAASIALQGFRVSPYLAGDPSFLDDADAHATEAEALSQKLHGKTRARVLGNICQLRGQIALARGDLPGSANAWRSAAAQFDEAELAMQAANSKYIAGCMALNAANATQGDEFKRNAADAHTLLSEALAYYERNDMRREAASSAHKLAMLYDNLRRLTEGDTAEEMRKAALAYLAAAEAYLDAMRSEYAVGSVLDARRGKVGVVSQSRDIYNLAIAIETEAAGRREHAWLWHQKSRGRALSDALGATARPHTLLAATLPSRPDLATLVDAEWKVTQQIRDVKPAERPALRDQQSRLREEMAKHPELTEYLGLRLGRVPSLDSIRAHLAAQTGGPVYAVDWVSALGRIGIMVTSAKGVHPIVWLPITEQRLRAIVGQWSNWDSFREKLLNSPDLFAPLACLVEPLAHLTEPDNLLVLCPSGPLAAVPLHALSIAGAPLIARNPIAYAPSLSALHILLNRRQTDAGARRNALLADPTGDRAAALGLAQELGPLLGAEPLVGETATRDACLAALREAAIFHFQGHARFDRRDPLQSCLLLSDKNVTAQDIMLAGSVAAKLVTLGACESAATWMDPGDDPLGLIPALLMAGARAVCAALWPVDAAAATPFMRHFYNRLLDPKQPVTTAQAMRAAVREQRQHSASLYDWAPYVLYGDWA